jgi:hypothetical protein
LICGITFLVSLFNPNVRSYEVNNRGRWYDFGFLLGIGLPSAISGFSQGVRGAGAV